MNANLLVTRQVARSAPRLALAAAVGVTLSFGLVFKADLSAASAPQTPLAAASSVDAAERAARIAHARQVLQAKQELKRRESMAMLHLLRIASAHQIGAAGL